MRFLFLILIFYSAFLGANPVAVSVDRSSIHLNESFNITFSTDEAPDKNPNFEPLKKDFEIINKNHGSTISWVNGKRLVKIEWIFTVIAKKSGQLNVPAINFGSVNSALASILVNEVLPVQTEFQDIDAAIFVEVEATPLKPYVQSQIIYTLRFLSRVNIVETQLAPLTLPNVVIEKLGDDKHYETQRGSISYGVTERRYALFPQKSGTLTIPSLELTAAVLTNNRSQFNRLFGTQDTRRMQVKSKTLTLDVQPIPADFKGNTWLAANHMTLSETWSRDRQQITIGEPLTRTLSLRVEGLTKGQLPILQAPFNEKNLKSYPDQPTLKEERTETGIIAFREEKIAFIPAQKGDYILPEIAIDWFNLKTGKIETLRLPRTKITAIGSSVKGEDPSILHRKTLENSHKLSREEITQPKITQHNNRTWWWPALSAFFAMGWGLTLWRLFHKKTPVSNTKEVIKKENNRAYKKALVAACHQNNGSLAKNALLGWGALNGYDGASLGLLAPFCDPDLRGEILVLNQNLYSQYPKEWDGELLLKAFNQHKVNPKIPKKLKDDLLEPLYKI
jgi:hypothetical protein